MVIQVLNSKLGITLRVISDIEKLKQINKALCTQQFFSMLDIHNLEIRDTLMWRSISKFTCSLGQST